MKTIKCLCSNCNRINNHDVTNEDKQTIYDEYGWWEARIFQIIKCKGCDTFSFRKICTDPSTEYDDDAIVQELFPKRDINSLVIKNYFNISNNIKRIYRETIDAYNNELFILCSAGLRAIIEGVCNEKLITGGPVKNTKNQIVNSKTLAGKIEGLVEKGFLAKTNANSLHELRFLGNAAVHSLEMPTVHELKIAIKIIENLIENIFEIEHSTKSLKIETEKRRKNKKVKE